MYGFCFGIELTMNNIIVSYLFDQFGVSLFVAGVLGSLFGLMNICARSIGGLGSDMMGAHTCMHAFMAFVLKTFWKLLPKQPHMLHV